MDTLDSFSADESSTTDHDSGSVATGYGSRKEATRSLTSKLWEHIDFDKLSPTSRAVQYLVGEQLMNDEYNGSKLARELGRTASWMSERLSELRAELLLQAGKFLPLTQSEYESLKLDIERNGIQVPIVIGEHVPLVDGRHRCLIAKELGLEQIPAIFLQGYTEQQERDLAYSLNTARRQLTRAQKVAIARSELMRNRNRSDRTVAGISGLDRPSVAALRAEIIRGEQHTVSEDEIDAYESRQNAKTLAKVMERSSEPETDVVDVDKSNHVYHIQEKSGMVPAEKPLDAHPRSLPRDVRVDTRERVYSTELKLNKKAEPKTKTWLVSECPHCGEEISVISVNGEMQLS